MDFTPLENILDFSLHPDHYKERVQKRWDYIQEQLKTDPDFVAYDYLEYRNLHSDTLWVNKKILVDTKGNFYLKKENGWVPSRFKCKYGLQLTVTNSLEYLQVRRTLGTMFIPIPESFSEIPFYKLDIKFIDGNSGNIDLNNLKWVVRKRWDVFLPELPKPLTEILDLKYDEAMTYEERVQKRYNYVKEQLDKNPKYECWDYPEYINGRSEFKHLIGFEYLVSTKGRIISLHRNKRGYKVLSIDVVKGYSHQTLSITEVRRQWSTHRIVCSTFIVKPSHYKEGLNELLVNHKDLNKLNNDFINLEWCTEQENVHHQLITYGSRNTLFNGIFEGTIIVDSKYKGTKFKVFGTDGLKDIGMDKDLLSNYFTKNRPHTFGCTWKYITQEEADKLPYVPEFIKDKLLYDRSYMDIRIRPLKGTVVKDCEFKGLQFVVYGGKELESFGFSPSDIAKTIFTRKLSKGCEWEYISRDEAELLPRGLTKEQCLVITSSKH